MTTLEILAPYLPLAEYPDYLVSTTGQVFKKTGQTLKQGTDNGYCRASLRHSITRKQVRVYVHRLVAAAFVPAIEGKDFVNHKDGNKQNNDAANLEWVTHQENMLHSARVLKSDTPTGERHGMSKLTGEQVEKIRGRLREGLTQKAIAQEFGISESTINHINTGRKWAQH